MQHLITTKTFYHEKANTKSDELFSQRSRTKTRCQVHYFK